MQTVMSKSLNKHNTSYFEARLLEEGPLWTEVRPSTRSKRVRDWAKTVGAVLGGEARDRKESLLFRLAV